MPSHEENRKKVCVICFDKQSNVRMLGIDLEYIVKKKICGFRLSSKRFPSGKIVIEFFFCLSLNVDLILLGICNTCRIAIVKNGINFDQHVQIFNYNENEIRCKENACNCIICYAGEYKGRIKNIYCTKTKTKTNKTKQVTSKICESCLSPIGKGLPHDCHPITKRKNLLALVEQEGLNVTKSNKENFQVTTDDLSRIKNAMNLSDNNVKTLSQELRTCNNGYNRKVVESHAVTKLNELSHRLDNFFSIVKNEGKTTVYCNDILEFTNYIISQRNCDKQNLHIKIGADGGGGSFKINLCIVTRSNCNKKQAKKDSGVKKMFIIGMVNDAKEQYEAVKKLWNLINVNELLNTYECSFTADLKLIMIMCGLMSNSSKCPCPYCETNDLDLKGSFR